jgi:hypothetical protein
MHRPLRRRTSMAARSRDTTPTIPTIREEVVPTSGRTRSIQRRTRCFPQSTCPFTSVRSLTGAGRMRGGGWRVWLRLS